MKRLNTFVTLALGVLASFQSEALARIGESVTQIDARYGRPIAIERFGTVDGVGLIPQSERRIYNFQGFLVEVTIWNGASHQEVYRSGENILSNGAVVKMMQANSGQEEWKGGMSDADSGGWNLGERLVAILRRTERGRFLAVVTMAYFNAELAFSQRKEAAQATGF